MATTLSRNLKLRISSNLTADARYNLERLDLLGSTFLVDSTDTLNIRSQTDVTIEPESGDIGGSGQGGTVNIGTSGHQLTAINLYSASVLVNGPLSLKDQATSGTKSLSLRYKSDISGAVDGTDRIFSLDMEGGNRNLVLAGDLSLLGGSLQLTSPTASVLTLPATGTLATLAGTETFTNKGIDGLSNTLTNISNAAISTSAAIAYSKLALTNSIVNADVNSAAAIAYSKLNLSGQLTNSDLSASASIDRTKVAVGTANWVLINSGTGVLSQEQYLSKSRGGAGTDQTNVTYPSTGILVTTDATQTLTNKSLDFLQNTVTNIPRSAITLTGTIVNADVSSSAAIAYSKLALSNSIVDADVSSSAAIARSKIAAGTPSQIVVNDGSGNLSSAASLSIALGGTGQTTANAALNAFLPSQTGNAGKILQTDGTNTSWFTASGSGTVTSVGLTAPAEFSVSGSPITTSGTLAITKANQTANMLWAGPTTGSAAAPAFRSLVLADLPTGIPYSSLTLTGGIVNADVSASAAIALSKLAPLTVSRAVVSDGSGLLSASSVTATELGYVSGVTSAIQTQFSNKQPLNSDLTALAGLATTGLLTRTASGTAATRTITAGTGISVSNGDGVAGNPTISSTITQYTDEAAQDAVAAALTNTASLAFTYNDPANTISAAVLPAGVDHDSLLNYVANKHIDHSGVTISGTSLGGLTGGGTIAASRTLGIDPTNATAKTTPVAADLVLIGDSAASNALKKATVSSLLAAVTSSYAADWTSGTTFTAIHSLGTKDIDVSVYDITTGASIEMDSIVRTSTTQADLTASSAPTGSGWRVVILSMGSVAYGAGSGSVSAVSLSAPTEFTVSGSPVTTSGTLTLTKANQNANVIYAGPNTGSAAAPTFRALVAADLPAVTASRALVSDGSGLPSASATTSTEIGYVSGVTSAIQTQLGTKATKSQTFSATVSFIGTLANGTYLLILNSANAGTITETTSICTSGTATATFKVNTTALGGTANSVSSVQQAQAQASANTYIAGDSINVTISSASSLTNPSFNIKYTMSLA